MFMCLYEKEELIETAFLGHYDDALCCDGRAQINVRSGETVR